MVKIRFHVEGGREYRALVMEISTLVKTAFYSNYSMLSPLALPCLPNDEVVYNKKSSAFVFIEAKWRLSGNDHHHHMVVVIINIIIVIVQFGPTWF